MPHLVHLIVATGLATSAPEATRAAGPALEGIRQGAAALEPLMQTRLARRFLTACAELPVPPAKTIFRDTLRGDYFGRAEAESRPDTLRSRLKPESVDGLFYYQVRHGPILSYARMFEILGAVGVDSLDHRRVLDFGYGRIGHLRALASLGAAAVGVDIDPQLRALYSEPWDQGEVRGPEGRVGFVTAITGWFPGDSTTRAAVGGGYDLVISKNTLKGGSFPDERVRQRRVIDLGVSDSAFVRGVAGCLRPGGLFMMYTASGPLGNAACPFSEAMLRAAGFEIMVYDGDDSPGARVMMSALHRGPAGNETGVSGSIEGPADTFAQLTALYTLVRKAPERERH